VVVEFTVDSVFIFRNCYVVYFSEPLNPELAKRFAGSKAETVATAK